MRVNLTNNDPESIQLAKAFGVIAPPAILILDKNGNKTNIPTIVYTNKSDIINDLNNISSMKK